MGLPNWLAVIALAGLAVGACGLLFSRWPMARTWPALVLLPYIVYPEPDRALAVFVAAVALVAAVLVSAEGRQAVAGKWVRLGGLVVLLVTFLVLYVGTLAPGVLPADSGELQVVAATLGIAHPPGFPLYTMLGHLWTLLPIGPGPAYRLNLFSAVTSTLALGVVYLTISALPGRRPVFAALTAAVALGTAATFWSQATTANIRSLTALLTALVFYCLCRFGRAGQVGGEGAVTRDRWLVLAALCLGLGITHHISLVFLALVALVYVLLADRTLWRKPRRWLWPCLAGLVGLLPLLYLPLRAGSAGHGADPQLATLPGFLGHVLATGFRGDLFYFTDPGTFWQRLRVMGNVLAFQFAPVLLIGMAVGLVLMLTRDRLLGLLWGGTAILFALVAATYRAPQTVEYMMPAYVALALCLGYAVGRLPDPARRPRGLGLALSQLFYAVLFVSAVNQGWQRFGSFEQLHQSDDTRAVAEQLLGGAPAGGTVLSHWHWATPMWYLQEVEGQRPDVAAEFVFPDGADYTATWATRAAEAFAGGKGVVTTFYDPMAFAGLPVPEPLGEAYLFRQTPLVALPPDFAPLDLTLGDAIELVGYRQGSAAAQAGEGIELTLAWQPVGDVPPDLSLFAHLVGPDGTIYGQDDVAAQAQAGGLSFTQLLVTPRPSAPLETLTLAVGAYAAEPLLSQTGEPRTTISNVAIRPQVFTPTTQQPLARQELSAAQRELVGYDWDYTLTDRTRLYLHWKVPGGYWTETRDYGAEGVAVLDDLPPYRGAWGVPESEWTVPAFQSAANYVPFGEGITWTGSTLGGQTFSPGEAFTLDQHLHSDRPILRDYVVSTRLMGLQGDSSLWAWWDLVDGIPGLGGIPTLKWIHNSRVLSPHTLTVDPAATTGQRLTGALTLYDAFTNRPLPILDERLTAVGAWVPLGEGLVGD